MAIAVYLFCELFLGNARLKQKQAIRVCLARHGSIIIQIYTYMLERIVKCEIKCLRKAANKTKLGKVRIEEIREVIGTTPALWRIQRL